MARDKFLTSRYVNRSVRLALVIGLVPASAFQAKRASSADLSPRTIRAELTARGLNLSKPSTPTALRDALVVYDYQAGNGVNLNSNTDEVLKAIKGLNEELGQTSLQSHVTVRTKNSGARVWYRLIGREDSHPFNQLTNHSEDDISIGLYFVWAERNGNPTSPKTLPFRIIKAREAVELEESNR
jgi:hypothetical protein